METYQNHGFCEEPDAFVSGDQRKKPVSPFEGPLSRDKADVRTSGSRISRSLFTLRAVIVLAFALRAGFMLVSTDSANHEGIYYLRVAENLLAGKGYVGLRENGLQLLYPPLFPGAIALATALVGNAESAARLIDLLAGTALVIPIYLIARRLGGERVALLSAFLAAVHPYLVALSTSIFSENLYLLFLLAGVYGVIGARSDARYAWCSAALAGACFGLAYLARPEGLVFAGVGAIALSLVKSGRPILRLRLAVILAGCTAVIALPYMAWLTASTGQLLLESKSADNYAAKKQILAHVPLGEIFFGINDDLSPKGASMESNAEEIRQWHQDSYHAVRFAIETAPQSIWDVVRWLVFKRVLGGPVLVVCAITGLICGIRRREPWFIHGALLALAGGALLALLFVPTQRVFQDRYLVSFLPPMLIWSAGGIAIMSAWIGEKAVARGWVAAAGRTRRRVEVAASVLPAALLILLPLSTLRGTSEFGQGWGDSHVAKQVGLWLKGHLSGQHARVMDLTPTVAYYSGSTMACFPWTTPDKALAYIESKKIDYLVLPSRADETIPYLASWIKDGIPDKRATAIHRAQDRGGGEIVVYRWAH
ncbi:MAG: glycosyltransferase family 39 protein [Verrucomicrobia bacterium]|nr:glycosyltransferase family 39 protein [Verrucomicrobiota bacterium]